MKMLRDTSRSAAFPSLLCIFCFLLLVATAGGQTCGQSLALTESTKAFYRGDYSRAAELAEKHLRADRKSTRLNSSHGYISYAVFCLKKKKKTTVRSRPSPTAQSSKTTHMRTAHSHKCVNHTLPKAGSTACAPRPTTPQSHQPRATDR